MSRTPSARRYRAAWWLPDPHSATLWGRLGRREPPLSTAVERWDTPDGDFVEVARLAGAHGPTSPRLLLLHGLEGGMHSHYARAMFREARARGWAADLLLFRTCGSEPNRLPRSYHSGETSDPLWVVQQITRAFPDAPLGMVGVSLGGNVLCKLLGDHGPGLPPQVTGAVAMSVPFDLARASRHIGRGVGAVYERAFLRSLIPKALRKIDRHPELAPLRVVARARTLWEFDDAFTAPLHGFRNAADYYARASSLPVLADHAPSVLDEVRNEVARTPFVEVEFPRRGGHVGFTAGPPWRPWYYGEWRAAEFLGQGFSAFHPVLHDAAVAP